MKGTFFPESSQISETRWLLQLERGIYSARNFHTNSRGINSALQFIHPQASLYLKESGSVADAPEGLADWSGGDLLGVGDHVLQKSLIAVVAGGFADFGGPLGAGDLPLF